MDLRYRHVHADRRLHAQHALTVLPRAIGCLAIAGMLAAPTAAQVATPAAPAPAPVSVEVSPLRVELKVAPGASHTQAITLTNTGKEAVRVRALLQDWFLSKEGAPQFQEPEDGRAFSASQWLRFAPPEVVIQPATDATVRFTLTVPQGVAAAGYRTGIMFQLSPASGDPVAARRGVAVRSQIATLIYANVGEPPIGSIELTDLRNRPTPEQTYIIATLKNTGRRTVRTKGTLTIYGASGAIREVPVPDVPLLPESERDVAIVVSETGAKALPPGEYRIEVKIDVGLSALIVGETTLKIGK
jgi:hypothetical protein